MRDENMQRKRGGKKRKGREKERNEGRLMLNGGIRSFQNYTIQACYKMSYN